ncbi:MAG: gamma-glutamyl-phosphate reductase, partial [Planctomycetales bacterium]|nr:gamma-glutamyl-phosphate reductase [Planctomycetales bacterium]
MIEPLSDDQLREYCRKVAANAKAAAAELMLVSGRFKNEWLRASAHALRSQTDQLLDANQLDLAAAPGFGLTDAQVDRL